MLKYFIRNEYIPSVFDLDLEELRARNIKGIITDLDNTLVEWDRPDATPKLLEWLKLMRTEGFQVTIVSNNNKERVSSFSEPTGIQFIQLENHFGEPFSKHVNVWGLQKMKSWWSEIKY